MKIIFGSKRQHNLALVSIFLLLAALIVGMVGCNFSPSGGVQYSLSISSTVGGSVITPGEGLFNYVEGTVVELVAEPDAGYRFSNWAFNVDTIADVYAASTTVTINNHYNIIAKFECLTCR